MKVVFAVSAMGNGGAERVVSLLSSHFAQEGHEVTILMVSPKAKDSFYPLHPKVRLLSLLGKAHKHSSIINRVHLFRVFLKKEYPDILISFLPRVCIFTFFSCLFLKTPYILSERNDPNRYPFFMRLLLRVAFFYADGCVFQTRDCLKWYRPRKTKTTDRIIFNPVVLSDDIGGLPKTRKHNVLFVGRLQKQKNVARLIRSFYLFHQKYPDYVLDVYGDGEEKQNMLSLIKEFCLLDYVRFHGKDVEWQKKEADSALFVLTSDFEGMPNALLEAAAIGIPCVSTDCPIGGSREISTHFPHVKLVANPATEHSFSKKMIEVIRFHSNSDLSTRAFDLQTIADQWLCLINDILRK